MKRYLPVLAAAGVAFLLFLPSRSFSAKKTYGWIGGFAKFTQIPGATRVGSATCASCHKDVVGNFQHAFHAQQGVECEDCHGPGSLHVQGGGDVSKIISCSSRSPQDANGVCLSCHAQDESVRDWMSGRHASNGVRCTDCHQVHSQQRSASEAARANFDTISPERVNAVEDLVPETKPMTEPMEQRNELCLRCHPQERAQMSLPYHHPLREGKMSCEDCHDPHGGPAGNNLRMASVNQLCLSCHAQYRGPFAYQHPPVTESCLLCHVPHGSPNTNLLEVSEPALCLQCHAGHHNGAGLPLPGRCTNCHLSIHGSDVPTPSGGSRFVDKGPTEAALLAGPTSAVALKSAHPTFAASAIRPSAAFAMQGFAAGAAGGLLSMMPLGALGPISGGNALAGSADSSEIQEMRNYGAYAFSPGSYRFVDQTGYGGRVGEYDTLRESAGADLATSFVSLPNHTTVVFHGTMLTPEDYQADSQVTFGKRAQIGFEDRGFVQQQDDYPFYAFPVLDVPPGSTAPLDTTTNLIPDHTTFDVERRLGNAYGRLKLPKLPVRLFVHGNWEAREGLSQLSYLDENTTPAVYVDGANTTCGAQCHETSRFQPLNYTTRSIGGGVEANIKGVVLRWEHEFSSFVDRLAFPLGTFTGPFTPEDEGFSIINPPPAGPAPLDVPVGSYPIDITPRTQASTDRVQADWAPSPKFSFIGSVSYSRLRDMLTRYPQNAFGTDETLNWLPISRLRATLDYHQENLINGFTPYYSLYGDVSYHNHWEGLRLDYELPKNLDLEAYYRRTGISRSNAFLWPQIYSIDNTDLLTVVPSSFSNTGGLALRYYDGGLWSGRAGYEWTGTHNPGYLIIPQSNNRVFTDLTLTPVRWLIFTNDTNITVQNAFPAISLPNQPGDSQRRNRFYFETLSATLPLLPAWNLNLGYSYQQNNLTTYMAFQNDNSVGYLLDEPAVPYKQIVQAYWGETTFAMKQRWGLNFGLTYNSARSGYRPDLNPNDAALLGNSGLINSGAFDPTMFSAALQNLAFSSTQISQVLVPQWIGESKLYYIFPYKIEGGVVGYYGSYRDYWNPNLNGILRTFRIYLGRTW
jgi:predicted CXXCH cytochrome family protein